METAILFLMLSNVLTLFIMTRLENARQYWKDKYLTEVSEEYRKAIFWSSR